MELSGTRWWPRRTWHLYAESDEEEMQREPHFSPVTLAAGCFAADEVMGLPRTSSNMRRPSRRLAAPSFILPRLLR